MLHASRAIGTLKRRPRCLRLPASHPLLPLADLEPFRGTCTQSLPGHSSKLSAADCTYCWLKSFVFLGEAESILRSFDLTLDNFQDPRMLPVVTTSHAESMAGITFTSSAVRSYTYIYIYIYMFI